MYLTHRIQQRHNQSDWSKTIGVFFLELVIGSGARYLLVEKQDLVISV